MLWNSIGLLASVRILMLVRGEWTVLTLSQVEHLQAICPTNKIPRSGDSTEWRFHGVAIPRSGDKLRMSDCSEQKIPNRRSIKNPYIFNDIAVKNLKKHEQSHIFIEP